MDKARINFLYPLINFSCTAPVLYIHINLCNKPHLYLVFLIVYFCREMLCLQLIPYLLEEINMDI
jgi:hypothetical protein